MNVTHQVNRLTFNIDEETAAAIGRARASHLATRAGVGWDGGRVAGLGAEHCRRAGVGAEALVQVRDITSLTQSTERGVLGALLFCSG